MFTLSDILRTVEKLERVKRRIEIENKNLKIYNLYCIINDDYNVVGMKDKNNVEYDIYKISKKGCKKVSEIRFSSLKDATYRHKIKFKERLK